MNEEIRQQLSANQTVVESPFRSRAPLVGPVIAWLRDQWNSVATKWYVRPMLAQQNHFNAIVVAALMDGDRQVSELSTSLSALISEVRKVSSEHEALLILQDRQTTALVHDMAELAAQLAWRNRELADLSERVARVEAALNANQRAR